MAKRDSLMRMLHSHEFEVVVIWDDLPAGYARSLAEEIKKLRPSLPVLYCSGSLSGSTYLVERQQTKRTKA